MLLSLLPFSPTNFGPNKPVVASSSLCRTEREREGKPKEWMRAERVQPETNNKSARVSETRDRDNDLDLAGLNGTRPLKRDWCLPAGHWRSSMRLSVSLARSLLLPVWLAFHLIAKLFQFALYSFGSSSGQSQTWTDKPVGPLDHWHACKPLTVIVFFLCACPWRRLAVEFVCSRAPMRVGVANGARVSRSCIVFVQIGTVRRDFSANLHKAQFG